MSYVTAACKAEQASTWLQLYTSSRMLDRLHWSAAAPAIKDVSVCSYSNSSEQEAYRYPHQRVVQDAAALLARTGHTATACGRLMVLIGGDFRDGPALDALDVAVLELDKCRIVQPRLHGQQPPSLQHHCTVRLVLEEGNALHEQVGRLMGVAKAMTTAENMCMCAEDAAHAVHCECQCYGRERRYSRRKSSAYSFVLIRQKQNDCRLRAFRYLRLHAVLSSPCS